MNVLAIKRSDESLIELGQDGMGKIVSRVLNPSNLPDPLLDFLIIRKKVHQDLRSRNQVVGHLRKHREKTGISGDESHIREMQVTETRLHSL